MKVLAERLIALRLKHNMSQRDLAEAANLSQSSIAHWEKETRTPGAIAIVTLAKFFKVSADYLLGLTDC